MQNRNVRQMKKDVWVSICGLHFTDEEQDPTEMITSGEYYFRNGKHYILYEEAVEGFQEKIKSRVKISGDSVEIIRKGVNNVHMVFRPGLKHLGQLPDSLRTAAAGNADPGGSD